MTHISIEHARSAAAPTAAQSAPRVFRVTGWDQDPAGTDDNSGDNNNATVTVAVATQEGRKAPEDNQGEEQDKIRLLRPYLLIERAEYLVEDGAPGVQTFAVSDEILRAAPAVGWVTLETQSNHGGRWTCLYGLRVHGQPVKNA